MKRLIPIITLLLIITSCREKMRIDMQQGAQMVGISASITDQMQRQEVILSRTTPFYTDNLPEMISDATVFVLEGTVSLQSDTAWTDTIWFEESDNPGYYFSTVDFAGSPEHVYHLSVDFADQDGLQHFYSDTKMNPNVDQIDSIRIKPWKYNSLEVDDYLGIYPYFQLLDEPKIYYMTRIEINGNDIGGDTLTKCDLFEPLGFAGMYVNSPLMISMIGETPIYGLNQKDSLQVVHQGDTVTMNMWSIPRDYAHYIAEIASSTGSNPMMGTPSNVRTNIRPEGKAVGMFHASSKRSCSIIY